MNKSPMQIQTHELQLKTKYFNYQAMMILNQIDW